MRLHPVIGSLLLLFCCALDLHAAEPGPPDVVEVRLRPVADRAWQAAPPAEAPIAWDEWSLFFKLRQNDADDELMVPLVPPSSIQVSIENHGLAPLHLSQIVVKDAGGRIWPTAKQLQEYLPRVTGELKVRAPDLWSDAAPDQGLPSAAILSLAQAVPLAGREIDVAAGGRWTGALVLLDGTASAKELAERARGSLRLSFSGVRSGDRAFDSFSVMAPVALDRQVLCSNGEPAASPDACPPDGRVFPVWMPGGPCLQIGYVNPPPTTQVRGRSLVIDTSVRHASYKNVYTTRQWIGGVPADSGDVDKALLAFGDSRKSIERARRLRYAGWTLVGAGVFGAAGTAGGLAGSGYDKQAPAGLGILALSGVGALLVYLGKGSESDAVRTFNKQAFANGVCSAIQ